MANTTIDIEGPYQTDSRIPIDEIDKSELTNPNVTNFEVILMSSLFVLTIVGNFIVIFILLVYRTSSSTRRSISRMSFYIINLSVADICVALMSILPATIWRHSVVFFSDLQVVCKLVSFSQVFSVYASTFMLIVMAYDRYMCICWPIKSCTWTYKSGMVGVILAWSLAALVSSPQLALFSIQPLHHPQKNISIETCSVSWKSKAHEGVYFLFHMSTQFLIPLLILTIFYTNIFLAVSKSITSKKESLRIECSAPESESTTMVTSTFIASIGGRIRSSSSSLNGLGGHRLSVLTSPKRGRSIEASKNSIELRPLEHSPSQNSGSGFFKKLAQLSRSASQENPGIPLPPPPPSPPRIRQSVPTKTLTKSKIKTLKLTLTVVITYVLCTMPFYISNITNYMVDVAALPEHSPFLTFLKNFAIVTSLLYQLNSCANPFIYMIFNGNACQIVKKKNDLCCRGRNRSRTLTQTRHKSSGQDRSLQTETSELIYSKLNGGGGGGGSTRK